VKLCGFLFRVPAQLGLCVEVVLLDTELEVFPFFTATAVFRIFCLKAGKELRFDGIVREFSNGLS
jgi:hypothetical protein